MIGNISNLSTHLQMQRLGAAIKSGIESVGMELTTGVKSNPEEFSGTNHRQLDSIARSLALSEVRQQNLIVAGHRVSGTSAVLKTFKEITEKFGPHLVSASARGDQTSSTILAGEAVSLFQGAVSSLNVRQGGRTLMSGVSVDQSATISADEILDALAVLTSNARDAAEVSAIVRDYFANPASGYVADAYLGSTTDVADVELRPDEFVKIQLRADNENFRSVLGELAQVALVARGAFQFPSAQLFQILESAGNGMIAGNDDLLALAASLGTAEEGIVVAQTGAAAEKTSLEIARNSILSVDSYEAASKFQAMQSQLQSHYTVIAKLSQLSLTAYLR